MFNLYTCILTNHTRTVLYAGVTHNLSRRLYEYCTGKYAQRQHQQKIFDTGTIVMLRVF
ncbi:GIY-YIG nuclease family protein [Mucilaginibacter sp.]